MEMHDTSTHHCQCGFQPVGQFSPPQSLKTFKQFAQQPTGRKLIEKN